MSWNDSPVIRAVFAVAGLGRIEWADPTHPRLPALQPRGAGVDPGRQTHHVAPAVDAPTTAQDETR